MLIALSLLFPMVIQFACAIHCTRISPRCTCVFIRFLFSVCQFVFRFSFVLFVAVLFLFFAAAQCCMLCVSGFGFWFDCVPSSFRVCMCIGKATIAHLFYHLESGYFRCIFSVSVCVAVYIAFGCLIRFHVAGKRETEIM